MGGQFAFLLPIMLGTVGCAFTILWRCGLRSSLPWAIGFLASAIGFTAPVWPDFVPGILCGIAANALFAIAFFAYGRGLIGAADRGAVLKVRLIAVTAAILLPSILMQMDSPRLEVTTSDLCCAVLLGTALIAMRRQLHDPARRVLFGVALLVELETALRGSTAFLTAGSTNAGSFLGTEYAFLMQAGAGVLGLIFALSALGSVLFDAVAGYRRDALVDPLSGLLNRRGFGEAARRVTAGRAARGAVIACDIDHFKRVNDRYGHPAGDAVIAGLAHLIRSGIPAPAIARRSGGEEFTIFLPDADGAEATRIANSLRMKFAGTGWREHGIDETLTASFGVAQLKAGEASLEAAIARADQALYDAKRAGRDRVSYRLQVVSSNAAPAPAEARCAAIA